jgi:hypothetical protein
MNRPERKTHPTTHLGAKTTDHLGASPAQIEHHAWAPARDRAEAQHDGLIDQARFLMAGQDPHPHAGAICDRGRDRRPVLRPAERCGGTDDRVNRAQGAGAASELACDRSGPFGHLPVDRTRLPEPSAQPTGLAGTGHRDQLTRLAIGPYIGY